MSKIQSWLVLAVVALGFAGALWALVEPTDRITYIATKNNMGNSVEIPHADVALLCGDTDGCEVRIGMNDWNGNGKTSFRHFVFHYNGTNGKWMVSDDNTGSNNNGTTEHVYTHGSCYFTDGLYSNFINLDDNDSKFSLVSWDQYTANCVLIIID